MCNICECLFGRRRCPRPEVVNIYPNRELDCCLREGKCCIRYQQFGYNHFPCNECNCNRDCKPLPRC